jgi:hypothetical protein
MRSGIGGDDLPPGGHELERLSAQITLGCIEELHGLRMATRHASDGEPGTLPDIVVIYLRHGCPEAAVELSLGREELLPLPL